MRPSRRPTVRADAVQVPGIAEQVRVAAIGQFGIGNSLGKPRMAPRQHSEIGVRRNMPHLIHRGRQQTMYGPARGSMPRMQRADDTATATMASVQLMLAV